jgi:uncharacterized protein YbjT (DUF2867 family)
MRTALIAGSTGLVGKNLLNKLLADTTFTSIITISRKQPEIQHEKLKTIILNFDSLEQYRSELVADDVFCCLGTTMKQAGSKEAFFKVDHDYPLRLAKLSYENGAKQFLLVSALGASKKSSFYYNEVKGKVEEAIAEIGFYAYHIFRPSLLLGPRAETRPGEEAAKRFYSFLNFLIPPKYKGIDAAKVAEGMLYFAKKSIPGKHIHNSEELQSLKP